MGGFGKVAIFAGVLLLLLAPTAVADSQTWYLEEKEHPTIQNGILEMVRGEPNNDVGTVKIDPGTCQTWAAAENTITRVEYNEDGWSGSFDVEDGDANTSVNYPAHLGHTDHKLNVKEPELVDGIVDFTPNGAREDSGTVKIAKPETDDTFQIPDDHYLTYRFCVPSDEGAITLFTDGAAATLTSPGNAPNYPTPELGSMSLTMAGLIGLAFVGHRRMGEDV